MQLTNFDKLNIAIQLLGASKSASKLISELETQRIEADPSELVYGESGIFYISPDGVLVKVILHMTDYNLSHGGKSGNINYYISNNNFDNDNVIKDIHKYHLINCSTLQLAKSQGWRGRYCISRKTNGTFFYRYVNNNKIVKENDNQKLSVCGNCLREINAALEKNLPFTKKNFDINYFFNNEIFASKKIPKNPNDYSSNAMPPNIYPHDWDKISKKYRENISYQCEGPNCPHPNLNDNELRKYLDCHHKDRNKANIIASNLIALCVLCHSKQPQHGHMAADPRIKKYKEILLSRNVLI